MRDISFKLLVLLALTVLGTILSAPPAHAQTGCWECEQVGFLCGILMPCSYYCQLVGNEEEGDGINCQQWWAQGAMHCNVFGGACFNIEVEGEDPDCLDYCPA